MLQSLSEGRQQQCTVEQAFRGIQAFVTTNCGPKIALELDEPLTTYEEAAILSRECPLAFLEDLADYFQFDWSQSRWMIWLKLHDKSLKTEKQRLAAWDRWQREISPRITIRKLAELISRKAQVPSFEPITLFGSRCEPAGVFVGLCGLPEAGSLRCAPSTPLRVMRSSSRIRMLWQRAAWINGVPLPALEGPSAKRLRSAADLAMLTTYCLALPIAFGVGFFASQFGYSLLTGLSGLAALVGALLLGEHVADRLHDPLPQGVEQFGDLARLIAKQRNLTA